MVYSVEIVYVRGANNQNITKEALPRVFHSLSDAEGAGVSALRRLRSEGKHPTHYLVFENGKLVPPRGPL